MTKFKKSKIKNIKKFRKGDEVKVVAVKERGKKAKVEKVLHKEGKLLIEGINLYKRHLKARSQNQKSEIVTISKPLPLGNVALICPKCHKQTRAGFKTEKNQTLRICRKCKAEI